MSKYQRTTYEEKAIAAILRGETPKKKVWIRVGGIKTEEETAAEAKEKEEIESKREILRLGRKPWFCPKCSSIMKSRLDDKMWLKFQTCFGCVVEMETELRIRGEYKEYEKTKVVNNAIDSLKDMKASLEEGMTDLTNPEFVNGFGDVERWQGIDLEDVKKNMQEDLDRVNESLEELINEREEDRTRIDKKDTN